VNLRFLIDENLSRHIVNAMRQKGWDVAYVVDIAAGESDQHIAEFARAENRILLTADVAFASSARFEKNFQIPTVLVRLADLDYQSAASLVVETLERRQDWNAFHTVLTTRKLRMRALYD
jgi:predicted nuclease of predicted toxin-antitoxin system